MAGTIRGTIVACVCVTNVFDSRANGHHCNVQAVPPTYICQAASAHVERGQHHPEKDHNQGCADHITTLISLPLVTVITVITAR